MGRRKDWGAEQIIATLRQIEVQIAQGMGLAHACKGAAISEQNSRTSASSERSSPASKEAQVVIGAWRDHANRVRPHSPWATDRQLRPPRWPSRDSYPRQPPCSSLTPPGPKSRSGHSLLTATASTW